MILCQCQSIVYSKQWLNDYGQLRLNDMIQCLCNIDWTAISAIATLVMAFATFLALGQSRKQLSEMKRQWLEEQKPNIEATLVHSPNAIGVDSTYIQLFNYGKGIADNISISFDDTFLNQMPFQSLRNHLIEIQAKTYRLLPNNNLLISFCEYTDHWTMPGYRLYDGSISVEEKHKLSEYLNRTFSLHVVYGNEHQYSSTFELSNNCKSSRVSSIQEELSHIQYQIGLLRTSIDSQNNG